MNISAGWIGVYPARSWVVREGNSGYVIYDGAGVRLMLDLEWDSRVGVVERERESAGEAVAAIAELSRDLLEPQEFGVIKRVMGEEGGVWGFVNQPLSEGYWYLNRAGREPNPAYTNPITVDAEVVDEAAMSAVVDMLFVAPGDLAEGQWPTWDAIHVYDTQARVPPALIPAGGDHLVLDDMDNKIRDLRIPLRKRADGVWVGIRSRGHWPPVSISICRDHICGYSDAEFHYATIVLSITVHWSVWWEEGSPGREMLDAALGRLRRRGWYVERLDEPCAAV